MLKENETCLAIKDVIGEAVLSGAVCTPILKRRVGAGLTCGSCTSGFVLCTVALVNKLCVLKKDFE